VRHSLALLAVSTALGACSTGEGQGAVRSDRLFVKPSLSRTLSKFASSAVTAASRFPTASFSWSTTSRKYARVNSAFPSHSDYRWVSGHPAFRRVSRSCRPR
jgi:hypothetical protein